MLIPLYLHLWDLFSFRQFSALILLPSAEKGGHRKEKMQVISIHHRSEERMCLNAAAGKGAGSRSFGCVAFRSKFRCYSMVI